MLARPELAYTSLPALVGDRLIGTRPSLVVSGTHGKTTTTAIAAFLLKSAGANPGWLIGGIPADLPEGGSNLGGLISPFMGEKLRGEKDYRFIAVEPTT